MSFTRYWDTKKQILLLLSYTHLIQYIRIILFLVYELFEYLTIYLLFNSQNNIHLLLINFELLSLYYD